MSDALSATARKAFLFLATFLTSVTVAISVRSFVIHEAPAISDESTALEPAVAEEQQAEKRASAATTTQEVPAFDKSTLFVLPHTDMAVWTNAPSFTPNHEVEPAYVSYGRASYHGHKSRTAADENAHVGDLTAAHPTLPLGTRVRVTNLFTGESVTVRINDRGPIARGRIIDLSYSAAEQLGIAGKGVAHVRLEAVE
jgi:rare lipoprotein A (peptidoglycan hydrolase)